MPWILLILLETCLTFIEIILYLRRSNKQVVNSKGIKFNIIFLTYIKVIRNMGFKYTEYKTNRQRLTVLCIF